MLSPLKRPAESLPFRRLFNDMPSRPRVEGLRLALGFNREGVREGSLLFGVDDEEDNKLLLPPWVGGGFRLFHKLLLSEGV
jgi:hypothetical protein